LAEDEAKGKPRVFMREATGLVKSVSAFDVLSFTVLAAGPVVLIALGVLTVPAIYQGSSIPLILLVSIIPLLALAYNAVALSSAMPRAGGDYVFGSRVIHPIWGMIPSFMIFFSFAIGIGSLAVISFQAFVGPAILTSYPGYAPTVLSLIYTSSTNLALLAGTTLVIVFAIAMWRTKAWFWLVRIFSLFPLAMVLVLFGYFVTRGAGAIVASFDSQLATGVNSAQVVANATQAGWAPQVPGSLLTSAGAMIFVFFFLAAPIAAYFAGEIKNTSRSMLKGVLGGTVLSWVVASAGILLFVGVFGYAFMSAYGFLGLINPATASTGAFNVNALVLAVVGDPNVAFLIGLGFALATIGLAAAPILPASRILFAWSFDRLIPSKFSSVSDRTHTPILSLLFLMFLTLIVVAVESFYAAVIGGFIATTVLVAIGFLPNGVTAALLPYRKKAIFESSPPIVRKKIGGIPLITITGLVHAITFAVLIVLVLLNPVASGTSTGTLSLGAIAVILLGLLASVIFYPIAKAVRKGQGIDLGHAYEELPPD
jgi:basic amino acid/polyamine antiporter, APA family